MNRFSIAIVDGKATLCEIDAQDAANALSIAKTSGMLLATPIIQQEGQEDRAPAMAIPFHAIASIGPR